MTIPVGSGAGPAMAGLRGHRLPGSPAPSIAQTYSYARRPTEFLDRMHRRYGDIFVMRLLGSPPWVCLSAPQDLEAMYKASPAILASGAAAGWVFAPLTGWNASLTMDGTGHAERRRLLLPVFASAPMKQLIPMVVDLAERSMETWPRDRPFRLHPQLKAISIAVVMAAIFGLPPGRDEPRLRATVARLSEVGMNSPLLFMRALQWNLGPASPWGRIVRLVRETRTAVRAAIRARRASGTRDGTDALSVLLRESEDPPGSLGDEAIVDELIALSIAGFETTHIAMAWVFECVLGAPEVLDRLRDELAGVADPAAILNLPYLDATIRESLRLRPPSPICGGRKVMSPITIGGHDIPPGYIVTNCSYRLHRRPDLFPDPEAFRPERFLGPGELPTTTFGGGSRGCAGRALAMMEIKAVVATTLTRLQLRLIRPSQAPLARGIHLVPRHGLIVEVVS
jgi:cytochrome P450